MGASYCSGELLGPVSDGDNELTLQQTVHALVPEFDEVKGMGYQKISVALSMASVADLAVPDPNPTAQA